MSVKGAVLKDYIEQLKAVPDFAGGELCNVRGGGEQVVIKFQHPRVQSGLILLFCAVLLM